MVCCRLQGGTGNQMFQISTTIALALKNNSSYKIPGILHNANIDTKRRTIFTHFPVSSEGDIKFIYNEPSFTYNKIEYKDGICLNGYFQSEKYFSDYRKEILDAFNFQYKKKERCVSIHIRRGDYLLLPNYHPVQSLEYIRTAIQYFFNKQYIDFVVFSDDIEWCKNNINSNHFPKCQFEYSEGKTEIEDMQLMSNCEHNIIANSSFSWWGAWLNQNHNKIVIAPKTWFGKLVSHNTKDLLPDNWIQL